MDVNLRISQFHIQVTKLNTQQCPVTLVNYTYVIQTRELGSQKVDQLPRRHEGCFFIPIIYVKCKASGRHLSSWCLAAETVRSYNTLCLRK